MPTRVILCTHAGRSRVKHNDDIPALGGPLRRLAMAMTSSEPPYPSQEIEESTFSAWLLVWTIIAAKAGTLLLVLWAAHDFETGIVLAASSWTWIPLVAAICASPILFRIRLRRVRAKREALKRAEWMVDPDTPSVPRLVTPSESTWDRGT
jgi:hypothetical protein